MAELNVYIRFDGKCKEAMAFYKEIFGGELNFQTVGESPMAATMPKEMHDKVLHAVLNNKDVMIMGSDLGPDEGTIKGNKVVFALACKSKEEIEDLFAKLSEGGKVGHKLEEMFFGTYGDLTDKFDVDWMLQFGPKQE